MTTITFFIQRFIRRSFRVVGVFAILFAAGLNSSRAQVTFSTKHTNPFGLTSTNNLLSAPSFADLDGDGDMDLMSGEQFDNFAYFQNRGTAAVPAFAPFQNNPFGLTAIGSWTKPAFADLDGDGDMDLMSGEYGGSFFYFQNIGTATMPAFSAPETNPFGLTNVFLASAPTFADLDGDGDFDLISGDGFGNFTYFQNTGTAAVPAFSTGQTNPFGLANIVGHTSPNLSDLDGDGDLDLISGEYYGNFIYFDNTGNPTVPVFAAAQTNPFGLTNIGNGYSPTYSIPTFVNLDGDGDMDLMSGEINGNFFYYVNTTVCNGLTVYVDGDGDFYGDAANSLFAADCIVPSGYVLDHSDCNDNNAAIHPGACDASNGDGVDENCNGIVDDGYGTTTYYTDADGDGYGGGTGTSLCSDPGAGYSTDNTDCDDANAAIHPGAIEVANGVDDDCNGIIDDVACAVPANLSVKNITASSAKLKWDPVAAALHYKVRYRTASDTDWIKFNHVKSNSKAISGLAANTLYYWQAKSVCLTDPDIFSDWSKKQSFTTAALRMDDTPTASFELYPNPVSENFTLDLELNSTTDQSATILLVNALGQVVYSAKEVVGNGELKKEMTMPASASSGWYIVRVVLNDQVMEKKLLFEK